MLLALGAGAVVVGSVLLHAYEWRYHRQEQLERSQMMDYAVCGAVAGGT